jgi:asparagine synthase (glutamine-hydrolysing)
MVSPCGRFVIVFNGEIYNFVSLREGLENAGERFTSNSDTEVLLRLWATQGPGCLAQLRGMYAFAIWDCVEQSLWLARDPLGIKPLYYCLTNETLTFASEIKALRALQLGGEINPSGVGAFLKWGSIPAPLTLYKDIQALPPASLLVWEEAKGHVRIKKFWDFGIAWDKSLALVESIKSRSDAVEWTRAALYDSVKAHLVSDVPVGAFLSGGIDSTAVVSLMRQAGQREIKTFSIGSDNVSLDEMPFAMQAAAHYQTEHHERRVSASDFADLRPVFLKTLDQPTIDGFNTFLVSRLAHEHGLKVVTSGVGGDEIFRGYPAIFKTLPMLYRLLDSTPKVVQKLCATTTKYGSTNQRVRQRSRRILSLLRTKPGLSQLYLWSRELFTQDEIKGLFKDTDFAKQAAGVDMQQFLPNGEANGASKQARLSMYESRRYLGSQLLADSDNFSMAHSLELRVPLVDHVLYEQMLAIQDKFFSDRAGTPKSLLVASVGDLPDGLVKRKKQGFMLPFQDWLARKPCFVTSNVFDKEMSSRILSEVEQGRRGWAASWALEVLNHSLSN